MKQVFIPCAGLGTRLGAYTKHKPKALVELRGKALLGHQIEKFASLGYERIIINSYHHAEQLAAFVKPYQQRLDIRLSDERPLLRDTGGGLAYAWKHIEPELPLLIHNVDIFGTLELLHLEKFFSEQTELAASLVVRQRKSSRSLGFCEGLLCSWQRYQNEEDPAERRYLQDAPRQALAEFAFSGVQIIRPRKLELLQAEVYSLIELYLQQSYGSIAAYIDKSPSWIDLGRIADFEWMEKQGF